MSVSRAGTGRAASWRVSGIDDQVGAQREARREELTSGEAQIAHGAAALRVGCSARNRRTSAGDPFLSTGTRPA
jgi:hypothetical protein